MMVFGPVHTSLKGTVPQGKQKRPGPARGARWVVLSHGGWPPAGGSGFALLVRRLARLGRPVACVLPARLPWERPADRVPAWGCWVAPRVFVVRPACLLPLRRGWPFDTDAAWNGGEWLSHPRAGAILREAGFHRPDVVFMAALTMPSLARQLSPRALVYSGYGYRREHGEARHGRLRLPHVLREADLVLCASRRAAQRAASLGADDTMVTANPMAGADALIERCEAVAARQPATNSGSGNGS